MEKVYLTACYQLNADASIETFKGLITDCIHTVARQCADTLEYYWYANEDEGQYIVRAKFEDSEALEKQFHHQRENILKLLELSRVDVELYGNVNKMTLHQFSLLKTRTFDFFQGISKENGRLSQKVDNSNLLA